jgi:ABC-2 type transport system permease protein
MIRKVWTIAQREYGAMVVTKAFLISIAFMPVLWFGGVIVGTRMQNMRDVTDKTIVIVDGSGGALFGDLEQAAVAHNAWLTTAAAADKPAPRYVLQRQPADVLTDQDRLTLSDQIRNGKIEAFVEIPAAILKPETAVDSGGRVKYCAQNAVLSVERGWLDQSLNDAVTARRLKEMNLDPAIVKQATARVPIVSLGLFKKTGEGQVSGGEESNNMVAMFVPFGFMMLLFMVIFLSAQPLLESVMEEKSGRIAEVLLGSVSASQLMFGKLLGNVAGSLTVVAIYAAGGYFAALHNGWTHFIPLALVPWFLVYQVLAVLLFSSIFMAVGAAVSQLKEAQSMLLPVWLLLACPMFVWLQIVREPNGSIATWLSLFPPATPLVMVLRLASEAVIPLWQIIVGLLLLVATTATCVHVAGRIFRIGILWQGKSPRFSELIRWAWSG